ncbi:MAG TPA: carboxypeptidase-like regulatory domain-containing protein [Pyrinomonadaceae bacterium]|nr:carboxypeptidase-like regulatory domain-containing protein [Pyrinomonadaceae bacterium]
MKGLLSFALLLLLFISTLAQKSELTGTVYDHYGAVVQKVKVIAVASNGEKYEAVTNDEGTYTLKLPFSFEPTDKYGSLKYEITFTASDSGFKKVVLADFLFVSSTKGRMYLDCVLEVRSASHSGFK